jgi:hypothetical protein
MKLKTLLFGMAFLCAWFLGAYLVELGLPTAIYAIIVVGFEIATMISGFSDLSDYLESKY